MAELTGISGLRCFCSDLSQALGCLGVLLPLLLFPVVAHGQLQWKCEGKRESDSLGNTSVTGLIEDRGKACLPLLLDLEML